MKELDYIDIPLRSKHLEDRALYWLMGYGSHVPDDDVRVVIESLKRGLMGACKARAGYRIVACRQRDGASIVCDEKVFHTGTVIAQAMEGATKLAVFTVTLGRGYEEWMEKIREKRDIVKEFLADAVASVCTDGVTEDLLSRLRAASAAEGLSFTNNYSPGYCSWPLKEQRLLFSFIPEGVSGIKLTEECVMVPAKSVSGIVGIGREAKRRPYGCAVCTMRGRCRVKSP